ncbi:DUF1405 domain-containing protein [Halobellus limi]|uniref:DUF1405 domain-containing protein n=1 Tax=Halobellus limi TaxID=699433 RepID=A0A1H5V0W2_9EURY|nr:DUF1405 domain-containing protein [Halobellus limi]QCC46854.1 DUF1405 domain-containing protein [Halobellus limi]SEF80979.1 Uncharacterized membrane protein YpjA [Halobellus limi]
MASPRASASTLHDLVSGDGLPAPESLPRWLAPLPTWLENVGLRFAWVVVAINLLGTAFGFWYYGFHPLPLSDPLVTWQFAAEPVAMWPFVPDSPMATLFIALAFASWKLGRTNEYLAALAFFGCWKLGLWTPYVLTVFADAFLETTWLPLYVFLFVSHLAMVVQAFVLHRIADFPIRAVAVALAWYGLNDVVDYFVPIVGDPHHTSLPLADATVVGIGGGTTVLQLAAAGAVVLTFVATFFALATRAKKLELLAGAD